MKNLFAVDFAGKTITATKTTLKKASIPNSAEYKALMKLMKQHPTFAIVEKEIKKAEGKNTYEGLKKKLIEDYIDIQPNAAELKEQYNKACEMGKFTLVRKWFLDTFKNFNVEKAKQEIDAHKINAIKTVYVPTSGEQPENNAEPDLLLVG